MAQIDLACRRIAGRQHGVISRDQARKAGMSNKQIRRRVDTGEWVKIFPDAFFVGGTTPTWKSKLCAALARAGVGSAVAGRSAGALLTLDGCRQGPVEIVTTKELTRLPFRCHRTNFLPATHLRRKDGILVTNAARTVFDLGALLPSGAFERAATDALRKKQTSVGQLRAVLDQLGACGRNGTRALRAFLETYDPRLAKTANEFEAKLFRILMKAGLALPEPQEPVFDRIGRIVRVDFIYRSLKIVIEADGFGYHSDPFARALDAARRNRLEIEGWLVLRFTWEQVMFQPNMVANDVANALAGHS